MIVKYCESPIFKRPSLLLQRHVTAPLTPLDKIKSRIVLERSKMNHRSPLFSRGILNHVQQFNLHFISQSALFCI
jgi:hypothetical protein